MSHIRMKYFSWPNQSISHSNVLGCFTVARSVENV